MTELSGWVNFYVIVGSSAGALIGLQFVVITLIADFPVVRDAEHAGSAFATPTILHFGAVLLLAAILSAPWRGIAPAAVLLGALGLSGLVYAAIVARRTRQQTAYKPEFEDWLFQLPTYNAYSIDGDVTGPLVFVNYGLPEDYEKLDRLGISVKGAIVIAKYYHSWRGVKPEVAAEHGSPINYLSSPQFGQATTMLNNYLGSGGQSGGLNPLYQIGGPRSIQLALKLQF